MLPRKLFLIFFLMLIGKAVMADPLVPVVPCLSQWRAVASVGASAPASTAKMAASDPQPAVAAHPLTETQRIARYDRFVACYTEGMTQATLYADDEGNPILSGKQPSQDKGKDNVGGTLYFYPCPASGAENKACALDFRMANIGYPFYPFFVVRSVGKPVFVTRIKVVADGTVFYSWRVRSDRNSYPRGFENDGNAVESYEFFVDAGDAFRIQELAKAKSITVQFTGLKGRREVKIPDWMKARWSTMYDSYGHLNIMVSRFQEHRMVGDN